MIFMNRLASRLYHPRDDVDPEGSCPHEPGMHESFIRVPARRETGPPDKHSKWRPGMVALPGAESNDIPTDSKSYRS